MRKILLPLQHRADLKRLVEGNAEGEARGEVEEDGGGDRQQDGGDPYPVDARPGLLGTAMSEVSR